jgi:hypothetical protein
MRVLVCGSRSWRDKEAIARRLKSLPADAMIVTGGALGADQLADDVARDLGLERVIIPANWNRHGRQAGILRNLRMLDTRPELVLAFWNGDSPGTKHTIGEARKRGIRVEVIQVENE